MAITQTVYSDAYPNNTKQITIDIASRVPAGGDGSDKYIVWVYTAAYKDAVNRITPDPIFLYEWNRGWAQSFNVNSPVAVGGSGTLAVAIDEADSGAVTVTVSGSSLSGQTIATQLENAIQLAASGVKLGATNQLSYENAEVSYEDGKFLILSGSVKSSYDDSTNWSNTSSVHVTGGTLKNSLGFTANYQNSFDLATSASGVMQLPRSAFGTIDDAIKWAVMTIANQIDYSS